MEGNVKEAKKFIKKYTNTYVELGGKDVKVAVDHERIDEDKELAGYFVLETSETDLDPMTLFRLYKDKGRIEWLIRLEKSEIHLRPVYVSKDPHIKTVLLTKFIGLVMVRALQEFLGNKYSAEQIIESLKGLRCLKVGDHYEVFGRNEVIKDLEDFFNVHFNKTMTKAEIKALFSYSAMRDFWGTSLWRYGDFLPGMNLQSEDWENLEKSSNITKKG